MVQIPSFKSEFLPLSDFLPALDYSPLPLTSVFVCFILFLFACFTSYPDFIGVICRRINYGASYTIFAGKRSYSFFNQTFIYNLLCVRFCLALVSINCFFCFININRLTHNTISGRYSYFLYFTNQKNKAHYAYLTFPNIHKCKGKILTPSSLVAMVYCIFKQSQLLNQTQIEIPKIAWIHTFIHNASDRKKHYKYKEYIVLKRSRSYCYYCPFPIFNSSSRIIGSHLKRRKQISGLGKMI